MPQKTTTRGENLAIQFCYLTARLLVTCLSAINREHGLLKTISGRDTWHEGFSL